MSSLFNTECCDCDCEKMSPLLIVCKGDDMDFSRNKNVFLKIVSYVNISGLKFHFEFYDYRKIVETIPESGKIELDFTAEDTKGFPVGKSYATVWLEDRNGKRRTITKRIVVQVTNLPEVAYSPCVIVF